MSENDRTEDDAVNAEDAEGMALDEVHKKLYGEERHKERHDDANEKYRYLVARGGEAAEDKLQYLESRCAEHYRNSHKEGKFSARRARDS